MEIKELEDELRGAMGHAGTRAEPLVLPTPWRVGPVTVYLFPGPPVTLVDAGFDSAPARDAITSAFAAQGLDLGDLDRVIVTHAHTDHLGCAAWLQERSGCEVLMHPDDIAVLQDPRSWMERASSVFGPLGVPPDDIERYFASSEPSWTLPEVLTPCTEGERLSTAATTLRVEHRPGHTPGHLWVIDEGSGVHIVGDHLLATSPTNAGLDPDPEHPLGRRPSLAAYNAALRALADRPVPLVLPGHGPPITDHRELIERRLSKSDARTDRVHAELAVHGPCSVARLARELFGDRLSANPYGFLSDLTGRVDLLVHDGRAEGRKGDDGVWVFAVRGEDRVDPEASTGGNDG